jgi:HD-GYP domain-containing protein (c-di-GMP phosphodiesterase class II)
MLRVPPEILEKTDSLTGAELQQVKTHPVHSYRIITKEIKLSEEIGLTALQHQERWDGQGYPKGLAGKDIMVYARIVAVADAFEAMVSERPYRDSMIGYTAMRAILSDNGRRFDPEILKIFIKSLGIYPIGSIVLLSDASIGRVIENHPDAPLRPRIRVMIDSLGKTHLQEEGAVIDLMDDRSLFIARAVNPKELSGRQGFGG